MDQQDRGSYDPLNRPPDQSPKTEVDYAAQARQAGNYARAPQQGPVVPPDVLEKQGNRYMLISIIVLAGLALIAGVIYWFTLHNKPPAANNQTSANTAGSSHQNQPAAASQITTATKSYSSPNFNLSFSYPKDWTIADNGGGIMTAKSPTLKLKSATGQSVDGQVVLTIRDQTQKLSEFNSGNATAVRDSVKIAYTNPTSTQRADTYISFLQYATTRTLGALDGVYITADNGYQKDGAIPLVDIQKVDPIISITFIDSSGKQMSIPNTMWDDQSFSAPLTKMLESFSIT